MSKVQELAAKAADVIRAQGWIQGGYYDPARPYEERRDCAVCLVGAVGVASSGDPMYYRSDADPLLNVIASRIDRVDSHLDFAIGEWNDRDGRTVDEVLALLDDIAAGA